MGGGVGDVGVALRHMLVLVVQKYLSGAKLLNNYLRLQLPQGMHAIPLLIQSNTMPTRMRAIHVVLMLKIGAQ